MHIDKDGLSASVIKRFAPVLKEILGEVIDSARDNLERNGSIMSEALTDSLEVKVITKTPTKQNPFSLIRGYAGVDVYETKVYKGRVKNPASYAPIVEYGGTIEIGKELVGREHTGKRGRGKNVYSVKSHRIIEPKPFMRPAIASANLDSKIPNALKKISQNLGK